MIGPGLLRHTRRVAFATAGLCAACAHRRVVRNTRGSRFSLCERSRTDPRYPRYPRLPVIECAGYEPSAGRDGRGGAAAAKG
jgi:hypothetical protein